MGQATNDLAPRRHKNLSLHPSDGLKLANGKLHSLGKLVVPGQLHHFFEQQCDSIPDSLALICNGDHFSYAALENLANRLAHYLAGQGVQPGDRVGILLERSVHTYVALLAVLKCGAAWVPIDPSSPNERIGFITTDADLRLIVTASASTPCPTALPGRVVDLDGDAEQIARHPAVRPAVATSGDRLCYVLYTSGTTGRPKGVAVNHTNICNFLAVCTPIYGVSPGDRIYQGMTIAFDFSVEEIWPTFSAGATLIAGPTDHRRIGPALAEFLIEQDVSVLYCVPTLLATLDRDVPNIHTLVVGGEACPSELVRRWARPGRRMFNTYGPTETTVTATWGEVLPERPITIGRPLPTYSVHLLDEALRPVPAGEVGEICIGGPGVACGYINCPDLTAARFIPDPFASGRPGARLYRSGDRGRFTPSGDIEFLGRADNQVKIRGFRIELEEIEAVLLECPEVAGAAATVVPGGGVEELAAYVTLRLPTADPDTLKARLLGQLRSRLPAYMIPAFIEAVEVLPTLPSGKVDRSRLPPPRSQRLGGDLGGSPPSTPTEQELAAIWATVFRRTGLSAEADFFVDLGGHSLLAAVLVSQLRQQPRWRGLALRDLYAHPSIRSLARHADEQAAAHTSQTDAPQTLDGPRTERLRHSDRRVRVCGLAQAVLLYLLWVLVGTPLSLQLSGGSIRTPLALLGAAVVAIPIGLILSFLLPLAVKWLLIGRFRPGRYPLWGWYFCRWWLVRKIQEMAPLALFSGSPFLPLYLRLLGARIGSSCHIGTSRIHLPDLVEIGAGVSLGYGVEVVPFVVEGGWLEMAPIRIAAASFVGANAVLLAGGRIGRGSKLAEQSLLARGQVIPDQEMWAGSPSERCQVPDQLFDQIAASPPPAQSWSPSLWAGIVAGLVLLLLLPLLAAAPGMVIAFVFADGNLLRGLMLAPLAGLIFVFSACVLILACKRLFLPTVRPGLHPLRSAFGLRKWLVDQLIALSLSLTNSLYGTLYTIPWLRLLGVKVGPRSEVSTVSRFDPDLLTLGRESFVADIAVVGAARHAEGYIALGPTRLGTRCFVGNAALLPSGTQLSDGILIGVHSIPPARTPEPGTSWLGSPAIYLPRRQDSGSFPESRTYHPPARLVVCRLAIEFFRVFLPSVLLSLALLLGTLSVQWLAMYLPGPVLVAALPLPYLGMTVAVVAAVIALKWLIVGRYRRRVEPLWSHFVWRTELITGLYESAAVPALLRWLTGTPLLAPFLRLFGARIGRRVYLDTTFLTEFDLVRVDDDAMIGCTTSLQTHLFEDRVMKMSNLTVGAGCAVGPRTVVLYDATLGSGAQLDALSLLMKGEELPPDTSWRGIPARLVENE